MEGVTQVVSCIHGLLGRSRHSVRQVDVAGLPKTELRPLRRGVRERVPGEHLAQLGRGAHHHRRVDAEVLGHCRADEGGHPLA